LKEIRSVSLLWPKRPAQPVLIDLEKSIWHNNPVNFSRPMLFSITEEEEDEKGKCCASGAAIRMPVCAESFGDEFLCPGSVDQDRRHLG
jgi:hypothetical protein